MSGRLNNDIVLPSLVELYLQITFEQVERFMFYERARKAFAVVHTGYVYTAQDRVGQIMDCF